MPTHNPLDVVANLERMIASGDGAACADVVPMAPWVRGHRGAMEQTEDQVWMSCGTATLDKKDKAVVHVSELPAGMNTGAFKELLNRLVAQGLVAGFVEDHSTRHVRVKVVLSKEGQRAAAKDGGLALLLKLRAPVRTNHMHAFDLDGNIRQYHDAAELLREFYPIRLALYGERRGAELGALAAELDVTSNRKRFVAEVASGAIELTAGRMNTQRLAEVLHERGYSESASGGGGFDYLLSMPLGSFTAEKRAALDAAEKRIAGRRAELEGLRPEDLWLADLAEVRAQFEADLGRDGE